MSEIAGNEDVFQMLNKRIGLQKLLLMGQMEEEFEWARWQREIPYISFPSHWKVKITPPFACAVVRFTVECGANYVSVYLDGYHVLGCWSTDENNKPNPYWEIYPAAGGDVQRYDMLDVEGLLKGIEESLQANHEEDQE